MIFEDFLEQGHLVKDFSLDSFLKNLYETSPEALRDNTDIVNYLISLVLKTPLPQDVEKLLLELRFTMLKWLTEAYNHILVVSTEHANFKEGLFVDDINMLGQPYNIHEHYYITDGVTQLKEMYYTGSNGLKYREVIIPNNYIDPGFLLDNSILVERKSNMEQLSAAQDKFSI